MSKPTYFIYNRLPGMHKDYSLAILAMSRTDANNRLAAWWHGGTYIAKVQGGTVHANMGDVTSSAEDHIHAKINADLDCPCAICN